MTSPRNTVPAHWNDAEILDGLAIVAKAELVDVPFRIIGIYFETNKSDISFAYVDAEYANGETFTFNDSSTGVRAQLIEYLKGRGRDSIVDTGAYETVSIVIPRGLRVSEFEVKATTESGRFVDKMARTYYLTTSGKRVTPVAETAAPKTLRAAATKATKAATR